MVPAPPHIPLAGWDVERRRLETTLEGDLSTLSLSSVPTVDSHMSGGTAGLSFMSASSIERPRAAVASMPIPMSMSMRQPPSAWPSGLDDSFIAGPSGTGMPSGPSGTPRAAARRSSAYDAQGGGGRGRHVSGASGMSMNSMTSMAESAKSTDGHHVSAMTLGGGIFRRQGAGDGDDGSEFDPDRSLGRLVGELGRVMAGNLAPRPASPFAHVLSPPRSPSPLSSQASKENGLNLSLTLTRADPLPSPPDSRGSRDSHSADDTVRGAGQSTAGFTSMAQQLREDLRIQHPSQATRTTQDGGSASARPNAGANGNANGRRALSDSTTFNIVHATPARTASAKSGKQLSNRSGAHLKPPRAEYSSAPAAAGRGKRADVTSDITGMTGLMATPAKGGAFDSIERNGNVGGDAAGNVPQTLATLHARLRGLETEGSLARRRVRELEGELDQARLEVESAKRQGGSRLQEVTGEKSALEELVASLRSNLARLTAELESNKALVLELQSAQTAHAHANRAHPPTPSRPGTADELSALRREIERLSSEIRRLGGIVELGLETRRRTREERTVRIDETVLPAPSLIQLDEVPHAQDHQQQQQGQQEDRQPSRLRQGLHASAAPVAQLMPPTVQPATRVQAPIHAAPRRPSPLARETREDYEQERRVSAGSSSESGGGSSRSHRSDDSRRRTSRVRPRDDGPASPFPSIRAEDEADFFAQLEQSAPAQGQSRRARAADVGDAEHEEAPESAARPKSRASAWQRQEKQGKDGKEARVGQDVFGAAPLPPQTVLARVIAELEDDYAHYRTIYSELAEQYKLLDASGATNKRGILAQHLKEVIDTLEQKAGQIQALYSLLRFQDRPLGSRDSQERQTAGVTGAPIDVFRMVRDTLGEEAVRRLEEDGVTVGRRRSTRLM